MTVFTSVNFVYLFFYFAVSLLRDLRHANIVTLHDIIHTDKSLTLVFEYLVSPLSVMFGTLTVSP